MKQSNLGNCTIRLLYISTPPPYYSQRWQTCIVHVHGLNNHLLCGETLKGQPRSSICKKWRTIKKKCIYMRKGKLDSYTRLLLIEALAEYFTVRLSSPVQIKPPISASVFCFLHLKSRQAGLLRQSRPSVTELGCGYFGCYAESLRKSPWFPSPPPSSHRLNQHAGRPHPACCFALVSPQICLHHKQKAVSPNDRGPWGRVGGKWVWKSQDGSRERHTDY